MFKSDTYVSLFKTFSKFYVDFTNNLSDRYLINIISTIPAV
jgi:hypothetical protein